jgi:hydrogenase maturation protease
VGGTLILALGNEVLGDDAVGLLAGRRVAARAGSRADHAEACLATIDLLPLLAGRDRLVVLDAYVSRCQPPGTPVHTHAEARPPGFSHRSFHTLPLADVLALGTALGYAMPSEVVIHGLCVPEPRSLGAGLSPAVAAAWPAWAEEVARAEFP